MIMETNLRELLQDLFAEHGIGPYGERNPNGVDSYTCPTCGEYEFIRGYASYIGSMSDLDHKPDCKLNLLYKETFNSERID